MNRCHGLQGPQNGSDLPSALGLVDTTSTLAEINSNSCLIYNILA